MSKWANSYIQSQVMFSMILVVFGKKRKRMTKERREGGKVGGEKQDREGKDEK